MSVYDMIRIGITERGDAGLDLSWFNKLDTVDGAILITKNPTDEFIDLVYDNKDKLIVHVTITGLGGSVYEPYVPLPVDTYPKFEQLVNILGKDRTVLRIDPVIPTFDCVSKSKTVLKELKHYNTRVRISFVDYYLHVKRRFINAGIPVPYVFHVPLNIRFNILDMFKDVCDTEIEICGEPGMDCVGCISKRDLDILGLNSDMGFLTSYQRPECRCLSIKKELLNNKGQCPHKCLYCYWK